MLVESPMHRSGLIQDASSGALSGGTLLTLKTDEKLIPGMYCDTSIQPYSPFHRIPPRGTFRDARAGDPESGGISWRSV